MMNRYDSHHYLPLLWYNNIIFCFQKKLINWKFRKIQKNKEEEDDEDGQMPKKAKKKPRKIVKSKEKEKADLMGKKEQDLEKIAENLAIDKNMPKQNIVQELTKVNAGGNFISQKIFPRL